MLRIGKKHMASTKTKRTRCEIYSRVVGYLRPINQWNDGKRSEFGDRLTFDKQLADDSCQ